MTVSTTTAALLGWAFATSLFLNWYWSRKIRDANFCLGEQQRINRHNSQHAERIEALLISGILDRAQLTDPLPKLNSTKFNAVVALYKQADMAGYDLPVRIQDDANKTPTAYWLRTSVNEFEAYELARLWLAKVL